MSEMQQRMRTEILDDEIDPIWAFFSRCIEDRNKEPYLAVKLADGRIAVVDCKIRVLQNG